MINWIIVSATTVRQIVLFLLDYIYTMSPDWDVVHADAYVSESA